VKSKNQKGFIHVFLLILILLIGFAGIGYYGLINRRITQFGDRINQSQNEKPENNEKQSNIFTVIPYELQIKENSVQVIVSDGFTLINSILSNKKDRIVYSEISSCIESEQNYASYGQCNWKYGIYVIDLLTKTTKKLYGYPEDKLSWIDILIPKIRAGGCPLVYLPIGWSKNDKKIILQSVNPTTCGSGGGTTKFLYASVNPNGGLIEGISNGQTKFYDYYYKAIFVGESDKSPRICAPVNQRNNSKLVFFNIESRENIKIIEQKNTDYSLGEILSDGTSLEYFTRIAIENSECAKVDYSLPGISNFVTLP